MSSARRGLHGPAVPSDPFGNARPAQARAAAGRPVLRCRPEVDLGLYSITPTGDLEADLQSLEARAQFRLEEQKRFRYSLEVFNPNTSTTPTIGDIGAFVNDFIAWIPAGITDAGRPLFLEIAYNGPGGLEELVAYDSQLVVGVLGGSAGTTRDAFQLLADARSHGARVAPFGRKINAAEDQLAIVEHLRLAADGEVEPEDAVRSYHARRKAQRLAPHRPLEDDLQVTEQSLCYGR